MPNEPRTWSEHDADRVMEDLRHQLEGAKARAAEMRENIAATGRRPRDERDDDAGGEARP